MAKTVRRTAAPQARSERRRREASGVRKERSAARREAILAAALEEFTGQGFEATRLDDVARRAGVAKGTIYLYFRDKDALFQELIHTMLTPVVGSLEALSSADVPMRVLADQMADIFVTEIFSNKRREVIRLMISEGRRFPKLAEFYYREVLSRIMAAMRSLLERAVARGEAPEALAKYPQLVAAPGLVAVIWTDLFDKYEPLDVRGMIKAHLSILFSKGSAA